MIVPRNAWLHRPPARTPHRIGLKQSELWLHHGASGTSSLATARAYAAYHMDTMGWSDIGYSFLVAAGRVLEGRGPGVAGGHTRGRNTVSYGICMVGSYSVVPPSKADIDALVWLLRHGVDQGWWDRPALTGGHRDAPGASTACPGNALHQLIPSINRQAAAVPLPPEPTQEGHMRLVHIDRRGGAAYVPDAATGTLHPLSARWQAEAITGDDDWHNKTVVVPRADVVASGWTIVG